MDEELMERALAYAVRHERILSEPLGDGIDGRVWVLARQADPFDTAPIVHYDSAAFHREIRCYERLRERRVLIINGFVVPRLVHADADLLALEMTIVSPPFVLDFAGAFLDSPPDLPEDV